MSGEERELKKELMVKRAQMKSTWTSDNYKTRWFVLTPSALRYYDGSLEKGIGNKKGEIELHTVHAIEYVESDGLGGRDNGFQVVYSDDYYILYVIAQSDKSRQEWVNLLRDTCLAKNAPFIEKYHPGVWRRGKFSCCEQTSRIGIGCKATYNQPRIPRKPKGDNYSYAHSDKFIKPPNTPLPPTPNEAQEKSLEPNDNDESSTAAAEVGGKSSGDQEPKAYVIALYNYEGELTDQDLRLVKGEEYAVLDNSREHWWKACNKNGDVGYIPSNYVQIKDEDDTRENLNNYEWYFDNISRDRCEMMLKESGIAGAFLLRDSKMKPGQYTLSILSGERPDRPVVHHYHIKQNNEGLHYLSVDHPKSSIGELINYHKYNAGGLVYRLTEPMRKGSSPPTPVIGHDKWELDPTELQLGNELGRGQFGCVLKARWRNITWVAVKTMQQGAMDERVFIEEAKIMQDLQHPNLVQLYGVVTKSRPIYIVTEFMAHGALLNYLRRHRLVFLQNPGFLLDVCVQVCKAMQYLESKSFIHRDLAARNCLVGDNNVVKVADFGLTRFVLDDEYQSSAGSKFPIKWAPPEVLSYTKFSTKSDVWAFGVLMWEVFTGGEMPYGRMRNQDVVEFICHKKNRLAMPKACPECVYEVMLKTWQHKPEFRPTFEELLYALSKIQEDQDYTE